jgi:hypothetical protein
LKLEGQQAKQDLKKFYENLKKLSIRGKGDAFWNLLNNKWSNRRYVYRPNNPRF